MFRYTALTILISLNINNSSQRQQTSNGYFLPGGQKHLLIGIFQTCPQKAAGNRNRLNSEATVALRTTEKIFEPSNQLALNDLILRKFIFIYNQIKDEGFTISDIHLITFEVCTPSDLANVSIQIHLDNTYNIIVNSKGEPPTFKNNLIQGWENKLRILAMVMYADHQMVRRLSHFLTDGILQYDIFPILTLDELAPSHIPNYDKNFALFEEQSMLEAKYLMDEILNNHSISYLTIINLQQKLSIMQRKNFESFIQVFNTSEKCFNHADIVDDESTTANDTRLDHIISTLLKSKDVNKQRVIMLFGNTDEQKIFLNKAISKGLDNNVTWLVRDVNQIGINKFPSTTSIYTYIFIDYLLPNIKQVAYQTSIFNRILDNLTTEARLLGSEDSDLVALRTYLTTTRLLSQYHRITIQMPPPRTWKNFRKLFTQNMRSTDGTIATFKRIALHNERPALFFDTSSLKDTGWPSCPKFVCPKGWITTFGHKPKRFTPWQYSQGWTCKICPMGTFKGNKGHGVCTKCPEYTFSSEDRSKCIDPYIPQYLWLELISVKLFLTLNAVGLLTCIFIMVVFFVYRKTPVVITSDYTLSQIHLTSFLINFASLPLVYLGIPQELTCMLKPILLSATSGVSLSIVVMKSHKMLRAYKSKIKISKKARIKSVRMQVVSIIFLILLGQAVNYVAIVAVGVPEIIEERRHFFDEAGSEVYQKVIYCDTSAHLHVQIVYFIVLQLVALVRAFQGRKLPRVLNDSLSIVYATFTACVIYATMFPIYFFQKSSLDGIKVHWFCLLLSNFSFMVIFYMSKINIILFHPNRNTKVYYRVMMMVNAKYRANRTIMNRSRKKFLNLPKK